MMIIEILCVGNELLSGITLNTNAHWIAAQVAKAGGTVSRVTVVRDELSAISSAVNESLGRKPDILVTTGGLGATYDDMTLEGVAQALGRKAVLDKTAVEMLKTSYKRRHLRYRINKVRLKMATIPEGSVPIENPVGSAPSVMLDIGTRVFCVPGVPTEMKAVFKKHILPLVQKGVGSFVSREANYFVMGVSEGMIAPALVKIVDANSRDAVYLKTHPRGYYKKTTPRIRVHLVCKGADKEHVARMLARISGQLLKDIARLGGRIEE
ncbi:putative nuleotide-utilizing enzyme, moeA [Candidatus Nitrososphaera evergladensis SR1]|uniref:Putative nuleotide-utilizing enzyme, moeA n=1 Tax=Candidatus Nitrososphaera evergladensis SR1 TaxID=1459636 RepID=A0A075MLT6_9ARCH|nr:molybdopterin-binding protein [Candidatus Nitrososphaera evergladensis]AIF82100.1 putative nuleotide-utilizing enzyme, moeA [Candidatus Nitrososphaera evergladensis SR1]